jgi:hypothetical protein
MKREAEAKMIRSRLGPISFSLAVAVTVLAGPVVAQEQAAIDKLVQMNKKALDDYDTLEWDAAKKTLLDALVAGKKAGLENHPVMARTYVHLGAVYITGFKNRDKAIQSFSRALEIDPAIQLSKGIATTEVNDAFGEAKRARGGGGGEAQPPGKKRRGPVMEGDVPAPTAKKKKAPVKSSTSDDDDAEERDLPVKIQALDCENEDEAILDRAATLRCALSPKLPVANVFLLYKEADKDDYTELQMTKSPKGWYVGKIPKKAVTGKSVPYFFEGRNAAGKVVVVNGERGSPNLLLLMEEEAYREMKKGALALGTGEDVDDPLAEKTGPIRQGALGHKDKALEGLDVRYGQRSWWIGLGFGSGFGYAKGDGLEAVNRSPDAIFNSLRMDFVAGGAWAGYGNFVPELGFHLTPNVALSAAVRWQMIYQPEKYRRFTATGAISGLAKLMFYTKQSQLRFFGTVLAGGGEGFRFVVKPAANVTCPGDDLCDIRDFQDTIRAGPFIGGVGAGMYYEASRRVSVVLEAHALAGLPTFGLVVDGTLALQFNFYKSTEVTTPGRYVPKEEDEEPK